MGKGAEERRAETKRCQNAQKENDVGCRSKEDCRCTTGAVGEGQGCTEEVGVIGELLRRSPRELKPLGLNPRALLVGESKPDVSAGNSWRLSLVAKA